MNKDLSLRIVLGVILGVSVIFGWWFIAIPIGILGAWIFPYYVEVLLFALMHDAIYGMSRGFGAGGFLYVIVAVVMLVVMALMKLRFRS